MTRLFSLRTGVPTGRLIPCFMFMPYPTLCQRAHASVHGSGSSGFSPDQPSAQRPAVPRVLYPRDDPPAQPIPPYRVPPDSAGQAGPQRPPNPPSPPGRPVEPGRPPVAQVPPHRLPPDSAGRAGPQRPPNVPSPPGRPVVPGRPPVTQVPPKPEPPDSAGQAGPQRPPNVPSPPGRPDSAATLDVPPGHLPPAGLCRVWIEGVPPGGQPDAQSCDGIFLTAPAGSRVLERPEDRPDVIVVRYVHPEHAGRVVTVREFEVKQGARGNGQSRRNRNR